MTDLNQFTPATSKPLSFKVVSNAAPTVLEAVDGVLEPINARDGATVRVKYAGMLTSDILTVLWAGNSQADTWESEPKPGSAFGHVDFAVPVSVVAASQDKTITVKYAVLRNNQPELSPPLQLRVGKLPQSELSTPTVPEADPETGGLDLGSFEGDAHVFIPPWRWIAEQQRVWINGSVTLENGTTYEIPIRDGQAVTAAEVENGVTSALSRNELEKLQENSEIIIMTQVAFDGTTSGPRIAFPDTSVRISAAFREGALEHFDSYPGREWTAGETIVLSDMQIPITTGRLLTSSSRLYFTSNPSEFDLIPNRPTPLVMFQGNFHSNSSVSVQYFHNDEQLPLPAGFNPQYYASPDKPITRIQLKSDTINQHFEWIFILK